MKRYLATAALICLLMQAAAQNRHKLDSMFRELSKVKSDTIRIHLLVDLAGEYLSSNIAANKTDSADMFIKQAANLNQRYHIAKFQHTIDITDACIKYIRNTNLDAKSLFLPLIDLCRQSGDVDNELRGLEWLIWVILNNDKEKTLRLSCYEREVVLYHKLNRTRDEMNRLRDVADIHMQQRKYAQAESELFQVINGLKQSQDLMRAYDLLGVVYSCKTEYNQALVYALKTLRMMGLSGDSTQAMLYYGRVYAIYGALNKTSPMVLWAKKALGRAIQNRDQRSVFKLTNTIVKGLITQGKADSALTFILHIKATHRTSDLEDLALLQKCIANCYAALGKYAMAENSYNEMISQINMIIAGKTVRHYPPTWTGTEYRDAGNFFIKIGKYNKAREYLLLALPLLSDNQIPRVNLEELHLSLFKTDSAAGNYQSAINHLQQSNRLKDSIFNITRNQQVEDLTIKYQTDEKIKDLKLAQNKAKLDQVNLAHMQNTRNWIIAGSGLLFIIAGLLYRQSRLRKKNNQTITSQNKLITHKNELLQNLVTEKEWLLKEVHHRVKNNLHSVICLLEAQAAYLENDALQAIANSQHRIYTMSLIHQKLYQSEDVKTIDMAVYVPELVQYLRDSFDEAARIHFQLAIDPIQLNPSQAIPLALIINEAITNAIKYAFPGGSRGEITLSLNDSGSWYSLEIADNGIGMAEKNTPGPKSSLGLELMKGLTKEIGGEITFENCNGVKINVIFDRDLLHDIDQLRVNYLATATSGETYL